MAPAAANLSPKSNSHLHTILSEYTDSTDALPHELTRSFGDLRELDAVLRASMQGITQKIYQLLQMMEDSSATPANRLILLLEIAEDAQRLKMGSEDKIRVAGRTCDDLAAHQQHIQLLLGQLSRILPTFESAEYLRRSTYPHVAPSNLVLPSPDHALYQNGRRKRVPTAAGLQYAAATQSGLSAPTRNAGAGLNGSNNGVGINGADKSVTGKRRRGEQQYEEDPLRKTPKGKERERQREGSAMVDINKQEKNKPRKSKPNQRSPSPSEDRDFSHVSHSNPPRHHQYTNGTVDHQQYKSGAHDMNGQHHPPNIGAQQYTFDNRHPHHLSATHGHSSSSHPKSAPRSHDYAHSQPHTREHSVAGSHVPYTGPQEHYIPTSHDQNGYNPNPSANSHPVYTNGHPHPSAPSHSQQSQPYPNGSGTLPNAMPDTKRPSKPTGTSSLLDVVASRHNNNTGPDYANLPGRTFEDDDYEVMHPRRGGDSHNTGEAGEGDEEERTYCYCERVSYGDMIACDGDNCEREWFHLSCVGMTLPPQGKWYCDECKHKARPGGRRAGRGGRGRITTAS